MKMLKMLTIGGFQALPAQGKTQFLLFHVAF